jgi:putative transposase
LTLAGEKNYSQRRACGPVGLHPKTHRYASTRPDDGGLRTRLKELASQRRRFATGAWGCYWLGKGALIERGSAR